MATPVEPVDEELGSYIECWFSVKAVSMKLTGIVVDDGVRWNWKVCGEDLEWMPRGLTSVHYLVPIAHPMWAVDCEDARSERWMAIRSFPTGVQIMGCGVAVCCILPKMASTSINQNRHKRASTKIGINENLPKMA